MASSAVSLDMLASQKSLIRKNIKASLKTLDEREGTISELGAKANALLAQTQAFQSATTIALYVASERLREVPTRDAIANALALGKRVYLPRVVGDFAAGTATMRMLEVTRMDEIEAADETSTMKLEEPSTTLSDGITPRPDVEDEDAPPLHLVVCPGVAFDRSGGRLGRGAGFYDAFLCRMAKHAKHAPPRTLGLCFDVQVVDEVPRGEHDIVMGELVTESTHYLSTK
ncbi:hypothetical protein PPROV_000111900 [Pycnococcus provasolii]|uniref:5-formyltetrahydrofolate cyclo-ligase n=1 Tax=Pycnococcus provasolii TaxID=41880 RepID=A0A830H717_9CHLO|nr:hypothetical protein PPROV_000111900 [Pycnococcus provasolii]